MIGLRMLSIGIDWPINNVFVLSDHDFMLRGRLPAPLTKTLKGRFHERSISAVGREATDLSLGSKPESGQ